MLWTDEGGTTRRPMVVIEDHLYHTGELLEAMARVAPHRLADLTVCAIDRPGPDTTRTTADWAVRYPSVRVVALDQLPSHDLPSFARAIAALVRPGGIIVQDVQLTPLPFVPADRWWESIYVAATIRGLFAERAPIVRFCSNKRGYDATFGKELLDAGFDPRDVMDKSRLDDVVVPTLTRLLSAQFPLAMTVTGADDRAATLPVSDQDRAEVERVCDLVLWTTGDRATLGGRWMDAAANLKPGSPEIDTWRALIMDRIDAAAGVSVLSVGERLADPAAERAELTNLAARHIHGLRARLSSPERIVTAHHAYRLAEGARIAIV